MALSPKEELELLQLEEEEYQDSLAKAPAAQPALAAEPAKPMSAREMAEIASSNPDNSSMSQAALSGAAQGATFGFSDELGAAKDVAMDVLANNPQAKKWREYQKIREAANMADQQANPGSYFAGELAGGIATTPLMPGLGGAKAVAGLSKLSPKVAAFLAGKGASAGSRIAGKGAKMAIEGAPLGALYGLGASENDISNPEELAKDAASSAAMGSIGGLAIGGAAQMGKEAIGKAGQLASKYDFTRKLGSAFDLGQEGVGFKKSVDKDTLAKMSKEIPLDITNQMMEVDRKIGKAVGDSLANAEKAGVRINIDDELKQTADETFQLFANNEILLQTLDPKSKALILKVAHGGVGDMSPLEARALKDTFNQLVEKTAGLTSDVSSVARQRGMALASALDQQLKTQVPEYAKAASQFADFRSSIAEPMLQPGLPSELRTKFLGGLKNKETDLYKGVSNVFGGARMAGSPSIGGPRAALSEITENLSKLDKSNPEAVKALGGSVEDISKKWNAQADRLAVIQQSQGVEPNEAIIKSSPFKSAVSTMLGTGEKVAYGVANLAGGTLKSAGQSAPVKASQKAFSAGNDALMGLANTLKSKPGSAPLGEALEKALMNKDEMAKNAVLFKMLQTPEYRNMLRDPNDKSDQ